MKKKKTSRNKYNKIATKSNPATSIVLLALLIIVLIWLAPNDKQTKTTVTVAAVFIILINLALTSIKKFDKKYYNTS